MRTAQLLLAVGALVALAARGAAALDKEAQDELDEKLLYAAGESKFEKVKDLLAEGANVNSATAEGETPLHGASPARLGLASPPVGFGRVRARASVAIARALGYPACRASVLKFA